jgi:prophage maintenance system killer protein
VKEEIRQIVSGSQTINETAEESFAKNTPDAAAPDSINTAIRLCLYCMRTQIFNDGNKRAAVIFANHFLIAHGEGLLVIPAPDVPEFKKLLVTFYETNDATTITKFLKEKCRTKTNVNAHTI